MFGLVAFGPEVQICFYMSFVRNRPLRWNSIAAFFFVIFPQLAKACLNLKWKKCDFLCLKNFLAVL